MRILTIDLEDWFHLLEWSGGESVKSWGDFESRIETATDRLLQRLDANGTKATFFCLGWIARRHRSLIRRIHGLGHEIGSHGDEHRLLSRMTPRQARIDLGRANGVLAEITGEPVRSFRAPGFSLGTSTFWMLDILQEQGIEVDSSVIATSWHPHGGCTCFGRAPAWIAWAGGRMRELPVVPASLGAAHVPYSGGGYFRILPYRIVRSLFARAAYSMAYFHPRDFDVLQPRATGLGPLRRLRAYAGLRTAEIRFDRLLEEFEFETVSRAAKRIDWRRAPVFRVAGQSSPRARVPAAACGAAR